MPITRRTKVTSSVESSSSRYTQGGETDVFRTRLGWWERTLFNRDPSDVSVIVTSVTAGRPDLIAFNLYQKANLQWLVLQYNNIVDVNTEIVVGAKLTLPSPSRLQSTILTRSTGGNKVA